MRGQTAEESRIYNDERGHEGDRADGKADRDNVLYVVLQGFPRAGRKQAAGAPADGGRENQHEEPHQVQPGLRVRLAAVGREAATVHSVLAQLRAVRQRPVAVHLRAGEPRERRPAASGRDRARGRAHRAGGNRLPADRRRAPLRSQVRSVKGSVVPPLGDAQGQGEEGVFGGAGNVRGHPCARAAIGVGPGYA